jgi:hypothetical protein
MRPSDQSRLDLAWARFLRAKRNRQAAERQHLYGEAATLELEEKAAHADIGYLRHSMGLDE